MLRYMADRPEFIRAMVNANGISSEYYEDMSSYIEKYGISLYGILVQGNVSQILSFVEMDGIDGLYVNDAKVRVLSH